MRSDRLSVGFSEWGFKVDSSDASGSGPGLSEVIAANG